MRETIPQRGRVRSTRGHGCFGSQVSGARRRLEPSDRPCVGTSFTTLGYSAFSLGGRLQNSRNSHLPPSSDPPGGAGKGGSGTRAKRTRKRGGQRRHRGARRELVSEAQVAGPRVVTGQLNRVRRGHGFVPEPPPGPVRRSRRSWDVRVLNGRSEQSLCFLRLSKDQRSLASGHDAAWTRFRDRFTQAHESWSSVSRACPSEK